MSAPHPLYLVQDSGRRHHARPVDYARLTPPQRAFAGIIHRLAIWRGANQIGKSWGLAYDIVHTARGTHPLRRVRRPPGRILVVGESWAQMDPLCEKLWAMLPKDEIDPRVRYEPGGGFRGFKEPRIPFVDGPGKGSVIVFATYRQGSGRIAGGSYHAAYLDEPPPETILGEVLPRLSRWHGTLRVSMTPTPESPPLAYLRKMVEEKKLHELQTSLTLDAITVTGGLVDLPWKTRAEMEELIESYLDDERDMRVHGSWDQAVKGRWLSAVSDRCVVSYGLDPEKGWNLAVGIDHGAGAGRQAVTLVACSSDGEQVVVLDEVWVEDVTSTREDALHIIQLLERNGLTWQDIDYWRGDRRHGGDYWGNEKSNYDLMRELARALKIPQRKLAALGLRISVPHKQAGSVRRGFRIINSLAREGQLLIHERCKGFRKGAAEWKGRPDDPLKDPLDSARYAIEALHDAQLVAMKVPTAGRYM